MTRISSRRTRDRTPGIRQAAIGILLLAGCGHSGSSQAPDPVLPGDHAAAESAEEGAGDLPKPPVRVICAAPEAVSGKWYHEAVGYEVFVRSFADSDGDGIGDLRGLAGRLDFLNDGDPSTDRDLGVDLLWLMPITRSPSYHGYDVTDYRRVQPEYGTEEDLAALLEAAHARGIRVVMDLVINHSSSTHPWFLAARSSAADPRRDWYVWSPVPLDWGQPWNPGAGTWHRAGDAWYYGLFWEGMPDLNWRNDGLMAEMTDVARYWLGKGLDGFRLDAARYLVEDGPGEGQADTPGTHAALRALRAATDTVRRDALLVGEVWTDTATVGTYLDASGIRELPMAFDFDLAGALVEGIRNASASGVRQALCNHLGLPAGPAALGTFLTNHDQVRLATAIEHRGDAGRRIAAVLLMTLPGVPWIYYGEEIGQRNGTGGGDEAKRLPMQWSAGPGGGFTTGVPWMAPRDTEASRTVAGQQEDPGSLLSWYRRLIRIRKSHPALARGSAEVLDLDGTAARPLAVRRASGDETVLVVASLAARENRVTIPGEVLGSALRWEDLLSGQTFSRETPQADLPLDPLPPFGAVVIRASP
ncbi:DUF3459 domain-containing protein [Myxococcota bacterium]|jgi:glycosidase|nr:DUF3459 domain-containing protein [Myxococcota bacterium]